MSGDIASGRDTSPSGSGISPSGESARATVDACVRAIVPVDRAIAALARERVDNLTKPLGSLGRIEALAVQLSAIAGAIPTRAYAKKVVIVGAADHGVSLEGVSAYPAEVTLQMIGGFLAGHAAINAFCRSVGADLFIADFGTREPRVAHPDLLDFRIGPGTANLAREPAMTGAQVDAALAAGMMLFEERILPGGYDVLAIGEMGIANTTSASAIIAALTGCSIEGAIGRGTGIDDAGLQRKGAVLRAAFARFAERDWRSVAREVGGFEIVGLAGVVLAAARRRMPVVLDGFITSAAALLARDIAPASQAYFIAAHRSQEPGHRIALEALELEPLFDLGLRLGEGTGAALALPLVEAASRMIAEMLTFAEASVATRVT
jgi:nicotinate-nucleotide--dimethylbenzimidazole phosphoribosyltransferase